jgi:hypothetical protein
MPSFHSDDRTHAYATALHHLNLALEAMVERGDTLMAATISHAIDLAALAVSRQQASGAR